MDQSWRSLIDLGVVQPMMFPATGAGEGPIIETARKIAEDEFFTLLEVTKIKQKSVREELRKLAEVSGLKLGFRAQPGLLAAGQQLADLDEARRKAAVENVKESLDQAYELGCIVLSLMDGRNSYAGEDTKASGLEALEKSLLEICDYAASMAEDQPIPITIEQFDQTVDKKSLIGKTEDAVALAFRIRDEYPSFGIMVDQGHLPLLGVQPGEVFRAVGDLSFQADIGNCVMKKGAPNFGDNHPRFGFPGGVNDTPELVGFLTAMADNGFFERDTPTPRPIITFEVKPFQDEDSDLVLGSCKRVFQEAWNSF